MSSGALHRLTEKKGKQLSKFLGIDSVPSTRLIANMQARINNPIFKLSIEDYEAMCGNKRMIRMMSKVIGCKEKQLHIALRVDLRRHLKLDADFLPLHSTECVFKVCGQLLTRTDRHFLEC